MSRYHDRYDDDRYYDDYDDGSYSYGESYASYRSRGSRGNRGGGGGRHNQNNDFNRSSNSMRHRGGGTAAAGAGGGAARIHPQDVRNGGGGGGVTYTDDGETQQQQQMMPLNNHLNNPNNKNKIVDFDSFTSDAEKLSAILRVTDVEMHKHALSSEYYTLRKYSILVPIIILSLFLSITGFIATSDIINDTARIHDSTVQEFLTLLVASCGFIVLLLTLLGNQLDYNSRIRFHTGAYDDLVALNEKMRMYKVERAMDERLVEEEMEEVRRREMEMGEFDGDTESDESELDELEMEDERLLLDEEHGGMGNGGNNNGGGGGAWDAVVQMNTGGEFPPTLQQTEDGGAIVTSSQQNNLDYNSRKQAAMERKVARQAKKELKLSKKLEKKNEYLTKELVNQKITQARQQQEMSKDIIAFYGYHTELHQIMSGCKSDVPPEISKFFTVMENRVELMSLSRLGVEEDSRMRKNQIIRLCATEVYNEIQGFAMWPMLVPPVDSTIEASLRTVGQLLNMNYRAQRRCKLIPCCPVPLCCKMRTSNNIFSVINEVIDQRDLDMMQAERVEVLRQVNERKARLMAGPAEVLELKDQEDIARKKGTAAIAAASPAQQWMIEQNTVQQQIKDYADYGDGYSRATVDPDGSVMMEMMTEASDSRAPRKKGGMNALGLYVHDEDDYESEEDGEEGTDGDGTGGGTFQGVAAAAPKTEVYSQGYSEDEKERERLQKKAKKAKKKAKKNKKNKKKSKKKAKKQESESESHYSDEEYEDYAGGDNFDDRSYSDEESGSY